MAHPLKNAEIGLNGLDDSITYAMVIKAVAASGGCKESDVSGRVIRRNSPNAMGSI